MATTDNASKKTIGRPSEYTPEIGDIICARIVQGESVNSICKDDDMPSIPTFYKWRRDYSVFLKNYDDAKENCADTMADEIVDIADEGTNDWMERNDPDNPGYAYNGEHVQRSRLRVDARKWIASKLKPKKFGDRLDLTSGGDKLTPPPSTLQVEIVKSNIEPPQ